jgi:hypothetical protein
VVVRLAVLLRQRRERIEASGGRPESLQRPSMP